MEKSNGKLAEFDSVEFEKRLTNLKDTQDSIQAMSAWCLQNRIHHKKIVTSWLLVLKQANDVIQYSKRKSYEFVESWGTALQRATTMVRDEKVKNKIERIFRIWEQRGIYNEEFLSDLHGLLSINPAKKPQPNENDDEQASITVANIKNCIRLEKETDKCFKALPKTPLCDTDTLHLLKDRSQVEDVEKDVNERRSKLEHYVKALTSEIRARSILIAVLDQSDAFYHNQRGEVKVVANAYRNFGNRIKTMKRKLEELTKTLPSPIPSPDINAPSPGPADNDFVLPGEQEFDQNIFNKQSNGLMGYMDGGRLPFDINDFAAASPKSNDSQHIQVINSSCNKDSDFNIDDFFKTLMPDTYTPAIPQPVPPVASSSTSNYMNYGSGYTSQQTPYDRYNPSLHPSQYGNNRPVPPPNNMLPLEPNNAHNSYIPPPPNPYAPSNPSHVPYQQQQNNPNTFNSPICQQPPLPPPSFDTSSQDVTDEYNPDSWEIDMSWNTTQDSSFDQSMDAPHSPPHYERKGINTNVIEYIETSADDSHFAGAGDVDHRQLILPMNGLNALGAKDRGRLVDVDHRNLISLTGSPKLTDKDGSTDSQRDSDLRSSKSLSLHDDAKLVPPPSPPAILLSTNADTTDSVNPMNPPLLPPPRFQSPPLQKQKIGKLHNRSPSKNQNGRDNTESIDMDMSDEDFDTLPEFLNNTSVEESQTIDPNSKPDSLLGPPPNIFRSPPPTKFNDSNVDSDSFGQTVHDNRSDTPKRQNPFRTSPQEVLHQLQQQHQQMLLHPNVAITRPGPRPLLDIPTGFNNSPRPFFPHHGPLTPDIDGNNQPQIGSGGPHGPFMMNNPRNSSPYVGQTHSPQMNFRGPPMRGNSPYFRNQKGPMRGAYRSNFRGGNMRGNW